MKNSGFVTHESEVCDGEQPMYVMEANTFEDLCANLCQPCACSGRWKLHSTKQLGHVLRAEFCCLKSPQHSRTWASSRVFGGHYLINQKLIHAFTCSGMLPSQYLKFGRLSGLGCAAQGYIRQMYKPGHYLECVKECAEQSMQKAVDSAKRTPGYNTTGEWVMTDARHDSTVNAYHSTVVCFYGSTKKVIGIITKSRKDHAVAQTHELACTEKCLPQVISRGLNVKEVAHDYATSVSSYITNDLHLLNSYDTWHGTKNVAKTIKKIAQSAAKWEGTKWFRQLSDKCKSTETHLYWSMKNCGGDCSELRSSILNIVQHYKGIHDNCHSSSSCQQPGYISNKTTITEPRAAIEYEKKLRSTMIFRNADSFCRCHDTFWVESFNHQLLTYLPKRIHFDSSTFWGMRMFLAVLDWNENSQHAYTSEKMVLDMRRPDRRTPMKVRVKKTYKFADEIWKVFVGKNVQDIRPVDDDGEIHEEDDDDEELRVKEYDSNDDVNLDGENYDSDNVVEDVDEDMDSYSVSKVKVASNVDW